MPETMLNLSVEYQKEMIEDLCLAVIIEKIAINGIKYSLFHFWLVPCPIQS